MGLPDTAYTGPKLAEDPRYWRSCGASQLAKTLAVYDRSDPGAARAIIMAGREKPGEPIKSETPCEPELLLFAGMNDHSHAAGLLEHLRSGEPTPKKIWEAIQTLFAAMNEKLVLVASRLGLKTKVVFASSPAGYAGMPTALHFVYAILILIAEDNRWRMLMATPPEL